MKRFTGLIYVLLLVTFIAACAPTTSGSVDGMINPGDQIDGMTFTTDDRIDWNIDLHNRCDFDSVEGPKNAEIFQCHASPGDRIFFGNCIGVGYDTPEEVDEAWGEFHFEVTFDDQPINLPAFGYLDFELYESESKYARVWNLMVEKITAGRHSVQCKKLEDGVFYSNTYVFTVSERP